MNEHSFKYLCVTCGRPARQSQTGVVLKDEQGKDYRARTLGTFSCDCSGRVKKTKVQREKA